MCKPKQPSLAGIHRHFVLYGLMEHLRRRFFSLKYSFTLGCYIFSSFRERDDFLVLSKSLMICSLLSFDRHFSADEVLQLLDRFYNLDMLVFVQFEHHFFFCTFLAIHCAMLL